MTPSQASAALVAGWSLASITADANTEDPYLAAVVDAGWSPEQASELIILRDEVRAIEGAELADDTADTIPATMPESAYFRRVA